MGSRKIYKENCNNLCIFAKILAHPLMRWLEFPWLRLLRGMLWNCKIDGLFCLIRHCVTPSPGEKAMYGQVRRFAGRGVIGRQRKRQIGYGTN